MHSTSPMHQSAVLRLTKVAGYPLKTTTGDLTGHYPAGRSCQEGQEVPAKADGICRKPTSLGLGSQ